MYDLIEAATGFVHAVPQDCPTERESCPSLASINTAIIVYVGSPLALGGGWGVNGRTSGRWIGVGGP
jgi:hypothetical protein